MRQLGLVILIFAVIGCRTGTSEQPIELLTQQDKVSYSIGVDIGNSLRDQQLELVPQIVAKGIRDAMSDAELELTSTEMEKIIKEFNEERMNKMNPGRGDAAAKNSEEGKQFLAANKQKEGVITTESGLQYIVIRKGSGRTPKLSDTVETHYRGTLINGKEFDSSYKRGQTISFPVSGVIKGWTEALQLMREGGKWQLFIPSDLAYGARGAGGDIGPNATLIFDIELISVK